MKNYLSEKNKVFLYMLIAMVLGYLPWYNFSAVSKYIAAEFSLSVNQTGIILSSFQAGYVIIVLVTGWLADHVGKKKVVAWATLCTAIFSTLFIFLAKDFTSILILRLITGLSAGAIYVPGMALLSNWFPPNERGKVLGAYTGALTLAYAGGYFVAAPIAAAYNWRYGMLWTSLPAFIAAFIIFFLVKEKPADAIENVKTVPRVKGGGEIRKSTQKREYAGPILITTGYMGHMWELYAFWGWIGPFMVACSLAAGYGERQAVAIGGQIAAFIILLGVPSVWLAGIVADKIGRTKTIIVCAFSSLIMEFFFGYLYGRSLAIVVIVGLWIGFWVVADSAIYKAGMTEMVTGEIRATALGVQSACGYFMTILSPFVFGKVLDKMNMGIKDATLATNWGIPFLILGAGAILSPISVFILRRLAQAKLMSNGKM